MANYTQNYGLHQWEPGDSFLRTDFNGDFAKIDGALGTLKGRVELKAEESALPRDRLLEWTTSTSTNRVDLDLSRFDLSRYLELVIYVTARNTKTESNWDSQKLCMIFNDLAGNNHYTNNGGGDVNIKLGVLPNSNQNMLTGATWQVHISLVQDRIITGYSITMGHLYTSDTSLGTCVRFATGLVLAPQNLKKITFLPSDTTYALAAGAKFLVYGVRK